MNIWIGIIYSLENVSGCFRGPTKTVDARVLKTLPYYNGFLNGKKTIEVVAPSNTTRKKKINDSENLKPDLAITTVSKHSTMI